MNILPVSTLLFALLSVFLAGQMGNLSYSQNVTNDTGPLPIPELKPQAPTSDSEGEEIGEQLSTEPVTDRFAAQIEFEPKEDIILDDYFDASNFAMTVPESSELCPTGNCEFELEGGQISAETAPGERFLTGKLKVDTGDVSKIMDVYAPWETVEERTGEDGELIRVIEGTFGIGGDPMAGNPDFDYRINGTMISDGSNYIVALQGER